MEHEGGEGLDPAGQENSPGPDGYTPGSSPSGTAEREARLRTELREERAKRLGFQFGLPAETIEELKSVPRDRQEGFVLDYLAANGGLGLVNGSPAAPPAGENEEPEGEGGSPEPPPGVGSMSATPSEGSSPATKQTTPAEAVKLQRSNPDLWVKLRKEHPWESERLLRGETVEGKSLQDLIG